MSLPPRRAALLLFALGAEAALLAAAPGEACAPCHREIYESYRRTPMAASSGPAGTGLFPERFAQAFFNHAPSGFTYRVTRAGGGYAVEFSNPDRGLRLATSLAWFVGSGATARSYLHEDSGFLFESPVAYYARGARWGLSPGYETYAYPYLSRPASPGCLTCHASFLNPVPGTLNRYAGPPFAVGGVDCERCHGPAAAHIERIRSGNKTAAASILNPARLDPERRDSICAQCHLSGEVRVFRPGNDWRSFHPGDRLADTQTVFVSAGGAPGVTVTGHVEKLAQSACKRAARDRLWCGSCHDPHRLPAPAARAAWFRGKCQSCHAAAPCKAPAAVRAARQDDCTACHMPKAAAADAQHVVYTDHSIPRLPRPAPPAPANAPAGLVPFDGSRPSPRDEALAYAIAALKPGQAAAYQARARSLLEHAAGAASDDPELLLYLAEIYRTTNLGDQAIPLYRRALDLDPSQLTAYVGLGGVLMERGDYAAAIPLWEDALTRNNGLVLVRTNLAMAYWRSGNRGAAEQHLLRAIAFSPGFAAPADLLKQLRGSR